VNVHHYKGSGYALTYFIQSLGDNGLFTDAVNGISVTQSTHGTSATTIQVTFGCAASQPSVGIAPSTVWAKSGSTVSLSAQVSNRDSAGCAATTFQLSPTSNLSASSLTVNPVSLSVAPGQSASATLTVAGVTSSGTVTLTARDSDGADPSHPQDGAGTAQIQIDSTAQNAPTNLSASLVKTGVKLTWTASTDNGGSGIAMYYVYRNGGQIGSTSSLSYTDTSGVGGTSYTYTVTALDVVGNESGNSNTATVTYPTKRGRK
jgi:chitinase